MTRLEDAETWGKVKLLPLTCCKQCSPPQGCHLCRWNWFACCWSDKSSDHCFCYRFYCSSCIEGLSLDDCLWFIHSISSRCLESDFNPLQSRIRLSIEQTNYCKIFWALNWSLHVCSRLNNRANNFSWVHKTNNLNRSPAFKVECLSTFLLRLIACVGRQVKVFQWLKFHCRRKPSMSRIECLFNKIGDCAESHQFDEQT